MKKFLLAAFISFLGLGAAQAQNGQFPAYTFWGNGTGSRALPSTVNISTILDGWLTCSAQGSMLYRGASGWSCLAPGTANRPLVTAGAGANPTWGSSAIVLGQTTTTSNSALAFAAGANGQTNPTFQVDSSAGSVATGVKVTGFAAAGGAAIAAISSGTNEGLAINAKGSGLLSIGNVSTGGLALNGGGGTVALTLGSDATGDLYYRNSSGFVTRLPIGSNTNVLTVSGGLPTWQAGSSAASITVGTTAVNSGTTNNILYNNAGTLANGTMASFHTAGAGIALSGTTNVTVAQSLTNATLSTGAGAPAGTTSAVGVMMGLGNTTCRITPVYSGRLHIIVYGTAAGTNSGSQATLTMRTGSGAGPANGAALTGTAQNSGLSPLFAAANQVIPFSFAAILTGLSTGTTYWVDVSAAVTAGTVTVTNPSCVMMEF